MSPELIDENLTPVCTNEGVILALPLTSWSAVLAVPVSPILVQTDEMLLMSCLLHPTCSGGSPIVETKKVLGRHADSILGAPAQDNSLLQMPPWCNPWLLVAMALSFALHFLILYVPVLAGIFSIVPLSFNEWLLVFLFAFPVVLIDEALKFVGRNFVNPRTQPASVEARIEAKKRQ